MPMLPIMLDLTAGPTVLYGTGQAAVRRLGLLRQAGAADLRVFGPADDTALKTAAGADWRGPRPGDGDIRSALALFVAGVADAAEIATAARAAGRLVNVEDETALCDFYTPSVVRRGDLVIAISTSGKSPGLARRIRHKIEALFGSEWAARVTRLADARAGWRHEGADVAEVARRTDRMMENEGWL